MVLAKMVNMNDYLLIQQNKVLGQFTFKSFFKLMAHKHQKMDQP